MNVDLVIIFLSFLAMSWVILQTYERKDGIPIRVKNNLSRKDLDEKL